MKQPVKKCRSVAEMELDYSLPSGHRDTGGTDY